MIPYSARSVLTHAFSNRVGHNHLRTRKVAELTNHAPRGGVRVIGASTMIHHRTESSASVLDIFNQPGFSIQNAPHP
jgi:hypothetical protein